MSNRDWSEVAAEAVTQHNYDPQRPTDYDIATLADAIRTALAGAGYTVVSTEDLTEMSEKFFEEFGDTALGERIDSAISRSEEAAALAPQETRT